MQQERQPHHYQGTDPIFPSPQPIFDYIEELRKKLDLDGLRKFAYILNFVFGNYMPEEERMILDKTVVRAVWYVIKVREQIRYEQKLSISNRDWILIEGGKSKKRRKG